MIDGCTLAFCLLSLLSKITNPQHTIRFQLVKDLDSNTVKDVLVNKTLPVTLYESLILLRDTDKKLELEGELLKW